MKAIITFLAAILILLAFSPTNAGKIEDNYNFNTFTGLFGDYNYRRVVVDLATAGGWETVATHEVFTVTGQVEFWIIVYDSLQCTTTSADSMEFQIGSSNPVTTILLNDMTTGLMVAGFPDMSNWDGVERIIAPRYGGSIWHGVSAGEDIGYEIFDHAATAGHLIWTCWYRVLGDPSACKIAAGAGGTL